MGNQFQGGPKSCLLQERPVSRQTPGSSPRPAAAQRQSPSGSVPSQRLVILVTAPAECQTAKIPVMLQLSFT
eukprot:NODE_5861_length_671_cov_3.067524_g4959_i0.p2 GENE.NODE_5861_length_671_cov_3.067524_g4959_i0~~NODE_5861_length_671_cov_3.067524_g4959_i0.p2  ORF type:complete len:72 (-),score=2.95 NODE_5861_length_671_cov_3.067524_g4959_i0:323-538(-)